MKRIERFLKKTFQMNETELILTDLLNCSRSELYLKQVDLSYQEKLKFSSIIKEREKGAPLQYILGKCEFFCLEFKIRPGIFIPRPETEILVEKAISFSNYKLQTTNYRILDIGTGSGNIAISLAKHIPNAKITAVDISQDAIDLAKENARLNCVAEKIEFIQTDVFSQTVNSKLFTVNYDVVVSNPPYIKSADIQNLPTEVKHEPRIALDGGCDGLDFYRKIIKFCEKNLKQNGILMFEIGLGQAEDIHNIVLDSGKFKIENILKDYSQIERVVVIRG
ncbi:MAG: peptide chain release factor N(5)-glutamine methyltransferase [Candidatus Omnitrophota bacterium]